MLCKTKFTKVKLFSPALCRTVLLCCLWGPPVDPPHNPTWNCRLLGCDSVRIHTSRLCGNTSRGPHLTTLHGHPVHVGCLEGAIGTNKTTQVQFSMLRTDNFCLSRFDIIATPSSIMTCFSTGYSICRTVYFGKDCWLVQLPKFRPRDPDPTLGIEFCQWKLASSLQTTFHCRKTLLLRIHL